MSEDRNELLTRIGHHLDRIAHSHKTQEFQRKIVEQQAISRRRVRLGLTIFNTLLTGGGATSLVFEFTDNVLSLGTIIAGISALAAIHRLTDTPEALVYAHERAAKALLRERNKLLGLYEECRSGVHSDKIIRDRLEIIEQRVEAFDPFLPYTSDEAYNRAKAAIATGGEGGSTQADIDVVIPEGLRTDKPTDHIDNQAPESDAQKHHRLVEHVENLSFKNKTR